MLNAIGGAGQAGSWFETAVKGTGGAVASAAQSFEQQLLSLISDSLKRLGVDPNKVQVNVQEGSPATAAAQAVPRRIFVSYTPPAAQSDSILASQPDKPASAHDSTATDPEEVAALKTALTAAGYDPGKFNLTLEDKMVPFPGGDYRSRSILATFDGGYQESYSADLTRQSTYGTVLSIEHTLRDIQSGDMT